MDENPYQTGPSSEPPLKQSAGDEEGSNADVVSDLVLGVNSRKSDNFAQAVAIGVCILLGGMVGVVLSTRTRDLPWQGGLMIGGFGGLVVGFFASGIFLMVYRGVKHLRR